MTEANAAAVKDRGVSSAHVPMDVMDSAANPLREREAATPNDDVEQALAALHNQDGSEWTRAVESIDRLMIARESALRAELRLEMAQTAPQVDLIRSVFAHLGEAPQNWHQSAVHFAALSPGDEDAGWTFWAVLGSLFMVFGQCVAAMALMVGTVIPSCGTTDQCGQGGTFCDVGNTQRCMYCGQDVPLQVQTDPLTGGSMNNANYYRFPDFERFNLTLVAEVCAEPTERWGLSKTGGGKHLYARAGVASWCAACVRQDGSVDELSVGSQIDDFVQAMGPFDWVTLVFASVMVGMAVVGELKDVELVGWAIHKAENQFYPSNLGFALLLLGGIRRWLFLPALLSAVTALLLLKGGDALSVCFNTIALLFILEIDNVAYAIMLDERVRSRVEQRSRVKLDNEQVAWLMRSKVVHVGLVVVVVPSAVWYSHVFSMFIPMLCFWVGGVMEAVMDAAATGAGATGACKGVARATGAFLLGMVAYAGLFNASLGLGDH